MGPGALQLSGPNPQRTPLVGPLGNSRVFGGPSLMKTLEDLVHFVKSNFNLFILNNSTLILSNNSISVILTIFITLYLSFKILSDIKLPKCFYLCPCWLLNYEHHCLGLNKSCEPFSVFYCFFSLGDIINDNACHNIEPYNIKKCW